MAARSSTRSSAEPFLGPGSGRVAGLPAGWRKGLPTNAWPSLRTPRGAEGSELEVAKETLRSSAPAASDLGATLAGVGYVQVLKMSEIFLALGGQAPGKKRDFRNFWDMLAEIKPPEFYGSAGSMSQKSGR